MFVSLCFSVAMETKIIFLSICHCQNIKILTDIIRDSLHICHMFNTPSSNAWLPGQACCFLFSDFCCFFSFWLTKWKALEYFWEHVERRSLCHEPTISQIQCSLTVIGYLLFLFVLVDKFKGILNLIGSMLGEPFWQWMGKIKNLSTGMFHTFLIWCR